VEEFRK
jgi:hypothetical protein